MKSNYRKCENGGALGETFVIDGSGPCHRKPCHNPEELENSKSDGENFLIERPICPLRLYQLRQEAAHMSMLRSRKMKCYHAVPEENEKSGHNKSSVARTHVSPSSRSPCPFACPKDEKDISCSKKKTPSEKSCLRSSKSPNYEPEKTFVISKGVEGNKSKTKSPADIDFEDINHVEGCTCLVSPRKKPLEGLQRLGFGKTTPDDFIMETSTPEPPKNPEECFSLPPGRRRLHKTIKQLEEEILAAAYLKNRQKIVAEQNEGTKKGGSCPPANRVPSKINAACPQISKRSSLDNRVRPTKTAFKSSSCAPKKAESDMGACPPAKNFQDKKYESNLECKTKFPQQQQECTLDGMDEEKRKERLHAVLQERLVSPCQGKKFIDVFADEECTTPPECEADGQQAAGNQGAPCAGENEYEDDGGAGPGVSPSSSENACAIDAGQNCQTYELNKCQKAPYQRKAYSEIYDTRSAGQMPGRQADQRYSLPHNLGNFPPVFQQIPQNYNPPPSQGFFLHPNNENQHYQNPCNSPTNHQPGQPLAAIFPGINPFGQAPMPSAFQGGYNQPIPEQFQTMPYAGGNQPFYLFNQPQANYNQMYQPTMPSGAGTQALPFGQQPAMYNQPSHIIQPNACPTKPPQRQTLDGRSVLPNRRFAHVDPNDFPESIIEHQSGPVTSTPRGSIAPPLPECLLSPILPNAEQSWSQHEEVPIQKLNKNPGQRGGEPVINNNATFNVPQNAQDWVSMEAYKSTADTTFDSTDPEIRRRRAQCYAENEVITSSMECQDGSYEESPGWKELPRSTRFPKKGYNSSIL